MNGSQRVFQELASPVYLDAVLSALGLKPDRIAVEHNGEIAPRATWPTVIISTGDKLEIVHFVGGGSLASF
jgi:sulfur carrier protein